MQFPRYWAAGVLATFVHGFAMFGHSGSAAAEPPRVVATILPLHSLAAGVLGDVAEPHLLLKGGASPHAYAMRPSDMAALSKADVVFWVGEELETFLARSLDADAGTAVALLHKDGITRLPTRDSYGWMAHDHGDHDDDHDDHGHDDHGHKAHGHDEDEDHHDHDKHGHDDDAHDKDGHDDHGHDKHAHDKHGHDKDEHDGHDHDKHGHADDDHDDHHHAAGEADPHIWLSPDNAAAITAVIADTLARLDPDNAAIYRDNARRQTARLRTLSGEMEKKLAPVRTRPYVVFHDAYQYFEAAFSLGASAAVTTSPERGPGARHMSDLRGLLERGEAVCVFSEPQFQPKLVHSLVDGTEAKVAELDPLGAAIEPGPDAYFTLLTALADSVAKCLTPHTD